LRKGCYASSNTQDGRKLFRQRHALALEPDDAGVLYRVACVYAGLGEAEEAIDCLEKCVASGMRQKEWFQNDSNLDPLREDPRFRELLQRL